MASVKLSERQQGLLQQRLIANITPLGDAELWERMLAGEGASQGLFFHLNPFQLPMAEATKSGEQPGLAPGKLFLLATLDDSWKYQPYCTTVSNDALECKCWRLQNLGTGRAGSSLPGYLVLPPPFLSSTKIFCSLHVFTTCPGVIHGCRLTGRGRI